MKWSEDQTTKTDGKLLFMTEFPVTNYHWANTIVFLVYSRSNLFNYNSPTFLCLITANVWPFCNMLHGKLNALRPKLQLLLTHREGDHLTMKFSVIAFETCLGDEIIRSTVINSLWFMIFIPWVNFLRRQHLLFLIWMQERCNQSIKIESCLWQRAYVTNYY